MIIQTRNTRYVLEDAGDGAWLVSGHHFYCPRPYLMKFIMRPVVGQSMTLEYVGERPSHPDRPCKRYLVTSEVMSIEHDGTTI